MTVLRFSDGVEFDTSGPLRVERRSDGLYVVGDGKLVAVASSDEGRQLIEQLRGKACTCCGRCYSLAEYLELPPAANGSVQEDEVERYEVRQCECDGTMYLATVQFRADGAMEAV